MGEESAEPRRMHFDRDAKGPLLILDDSHTTQQEAWQLFRDFDQHAKAQPDQSLRLLLDYTESWHEPDLTEAWQKAFQRHERVVVKAAVFGATRSVRLAVTAYRFFARLKGADVERRLRSFKTEEEARAWLLE